MEPRIPPSGSRAERLTASTGQLRRLASTVPAGIGRMSRKAGSGGVGRVLASGYRRRIEIDSVYRTVLGRYPTTEERTEMLMRSDQGAGFDELVAWLEDSDEAVDRSIDRIGPLVRRAMRHRPEVGADQPRLVFMHIMKVGGTSLGELMSSWLVPSQARVHQYIGDVLATPRPILAGLRLISGHLPYEALALIPGTFSTACVLRDPRERTVSHYNTLRSARPELRDLTLDEFVHSEVFDVPSGNYQARQLAHDIDLAGAWITYSPEDMLAACGGNSDEAYVLQSLFDSTPLRIAGDELLRAASEHLEQIDIVGVTGHLDSAARAAAQVFGVAPQPVPHLNRSDGSTLQEVPARIVRVIDERTAVDRELYDLALRRATADW